MSRRPTLSDLERILDEEEDTPVEILPNGEIRAMGGSDAVDTGVRKPLTMKENLGGEYMDVARLQRDIEAAKRSFSYVEARRDSKGKLYVKAALQTAQSPYQRPYIIEVLCDGYPNKAPSVYVTSPRLPSHTALEHRYSDDQICYMHPNRWNPGAHDIKFVVGRAAKWLQKYEIYCATGRWPGASIAH